MDFKAILAKAKQENLAIAKFKEENPTGNQSSGNSEIESPIEFKNTDPCPDFENLIPEYFTNIDGSKLMDTKTEDVFRLSQSFIASLREALVEDTCLRRLYYRSVERKGDKKADETEAMRLGTLYEHELTGAYDYNGNKPLPKKKFIGSDKETYCTADQRVINNAKSGRESLKYFGIDLDAKETYTVDTKFFYYCFDGSADLRYFNNRLIDCKYTGVLKKPDKFSKHSWNEENIKTSFSKIMQASLYSLLYFLKEGVYPTFDYIVFSNKPQEEAEFQIFGMDISEERFNMLKWLLIDTANLFQSMINENKFIEKPSFDNCKGCPNLDCKVRQVYRKKITVKI